jgi:hypothetical protein
MDRAFRVTGFAACFLALIAASGGHWLMLQTVAWTHMLIDYAQTDTLVRAVQKTFDGEHPCPMCLKIREGRKQEERRPFLIKRQRSLDLMLELRRVVLLAPPVSPQDRTAFISDLHSDFILPPPTPPPRSG